MLDTDYRYIYEALKKIVVAQSYEELNNIAYKYWGTNKALIKGVNRVILMTKIVEERRKELGAEMGNKQDP